MLHPEILENQAIQALNCKGGLFDVESPLSRNIGMWGVFLEPTCGVERDVCQVVAIQKDYTGNVVYRVTGDWDGDYQIGRPADSSSLQLFHTRVEAENYKDNRK